MHTALTGPEHHKLVWRPDWRGSICFLVSGLIAYRASPRRRWHRWLPVRDGTGWWQPAVNLLGCIFFGISAVAGYVVPSTGSMLDLAAANWNTSLGAACFLACALDTLHTGKRLGQILAWHLALLRARARVFVVGHELGGRLGFTSPYSHRPASKLTWRSTPCTHTEAPAASRRRRGGSGEPYSSNTLLDAAYERVRALVLDGLRPGRSRRA